MYVKQIIAFYLNSLLSVRIFQHYFFRTFGRDFLFERQDVETEHRGEKLKIDSAALSGWLDPTHVNNSISERALSGLPVISNFLRRLSAARPVMNVISPNRLQ
jgi:hypothetical protein